MAIFKYDDYTRLSGTQDGRVTFYLDSDSDVSDLPTDCGVGSRAYVIDGESSNVYALAPAGEWRLAPVFMPSAN